MTRSLVNQPDRLNMARIQGALAVIMKSGLVLMIAVTLAIEIPVVLPSATPAPPNIVPGTPSIAQRELAAARASLATGSGPAAGISASCSTHGQTDSCGSILEPVANSPTTTPQGREFAAMTYDPVAGFVLLFGGKNVSNGVTTILGDTWAFVNNTWNLVSLTGASPTARWGAMMTYDPSTGNVTLFGGWGTSGFDSDCWDFVVGQGAPETYSWVQCPTSGQTPPARALGGFVFDSGDGYDLLFGGAGTSGTLGDTWTYSGTQWSQITTPPGQAPNARYNFSMVYESSDGSVQLYGGYPCSPPMTSGPLGPTIGCAGLSDTWQFFGGHWSNITAFIPSNPSYRGGAAATYDAIDGYSLLFGGSPCSAFLGCSLPWGALGDTWNYSGLQWYERYPSPSPQARVGASIAYDSNDGMVVLFGGDSYSRCQCSLNDTWTYWAGGWSPVPLAPNYPYAPWGWTKPANATAPEGTLGAALTYDATDGFPLMFGGYGHIRGYAPSAANCTCEYVNSLGIEWRNQTGLAPHSRYGASMAFDAADGYVLLFGGWELSGSSIATLGDTWTFTAKSGWHNLNPSTSPTARGAAAVTYDPTLREVVLFGGESIFSGVTQVYGDTWGFSGGTWTQLSLSGPPARSNASFAFFPTWSHGTSGDWGSPSGGYDVLFGGYAGSTNSFLNDTWTFNSSGWTLLSPLQSPSKRSDASLTLDGVDHYLVLFGGQASQCTSGTASCRQLNDTWEFAYGAWTNVSTSELAAPPGRGTLAATYDLPSREILLVDGTNFSNDSWTYWTDGWRQSHSDSATLAVLAPGERSFEALGYDGPDRSVLMFGGAGRQINSHQFNRNCSSYSYEQNLSDTWEFTNGFGTNLTPRIGSAGPAPRFGASMTYDERDGYVVLFGGVTQYTFDGDTDCHYPVFGTIVNDTWIFENGEWKMLNTPVAPDSRAHFGLTYDPVDGYVLLFGGLFTPDYVNKQFVTGTSAYNDTWEFSNGAWKRLLTPQSPSARWDPDMVFDASDGYVLLWGGWYGFPNLAYNDTWEFEHGAWSKVKLARGSMFPQADQIESVAVFDPVRQSVFMFGGECNWQFTGISCNAIWAYHDSRWTNETTNLTQSSNLTPGPVQDQGMATDYGIDSGFMFGGVNLVGTSQTPYNTGWYLE